MHARDRRGYAAARVAFSSPLSLLITKKEFILLSGFILHVSPGLRMSDRTSTVLESQFPFTRKRELGFIVMIFACLYANTPFALQPILPL
jgi:hypothetical protein